ncbi:BPSS1780 family membrane protein [Uliginosibacterium gangwonense]|uniref:BPSS1780 family membrane protein n=1 Tax=Uliginosibacterium gangwonense TaxID=392736 RepID=UPI0003A2A26D|nr:BPSS1780 family membrane protein [Uliginosibacterium gangwonense]
MEEQHKNPYAPPEANVGDAHLDTGTGSFIPGGRVVPAGHGMEWISAAWRLFASAPLAWVGMFVVFALIWIVISIIPIVNMIASLLLPMFMGGLMIAADNHFNKGDAQFSDLFAGFERYSSPLIVLGALFLAFSFACLLPIIVIAIFGGIGGAILAGTGFQGAMGGIFVSIAIAVIVVLALMFCLYASLWFAPALVVLQHVRPLDAMKMSFSACMRNWASGLVFSLMAFLLMILSLLPLGLGLFVFAPVMYITMYTGYRDIFIQEE